MAVSDALQQSEGRSRKRRREKNKEVVAEVADEQMRKGK